MTQKQDNLIHFTTYDELQDYNYFQQKIEERDGLKIVEQYEHWDARGKFLFCAFKVFQSFIKLTEGFKIGGLGGFCDEVDIFMNIYTFEVLSKVFKELEIL